MKKIIILSLLCVLVFSGCTAGNQVQSISIEDAKVRAVEFINKNLMRPGTEVSVKEISEESGLFKIVINIPGDEVQEVDSFLTKDGKYFFPMVHDIDKVTKETEAKKAEAGGEQAAAVTDVPKTEKPKVELFVMSHCPYGTQIEKGIIPVIETLGDKVDFELKFCDYVMHGDKEIAEQLNQHCIQETQPEKLVSYLRCFLEADDGPGCLNSTGINQSAMNSCVSSTDDEFKITYNSKNNIDYKGRFPTFNTSKTEVDKYQIGGSPSLVINGQKISSGRDSKTLLKTICAGYENPPAECSEELPAAAPTPGFGWSGSAANAPAASCGE